MKFYMKKRVYYLLIGTLLLLLHACSKSDETTSIPACDTFLCATAVRPNGDLVRDYYCDDLRICTHADGYIVFSAEENRSHNAGLFVLRVGSQARRIFNGPGTYRLQDDDANALSYEYVDTTVQSFVGYGGYITVETASETELSGFFEVDAKNKNEAVYQKILGRFNYQPD